MMLGRPSRRAKADAALVSAGLKARDRVRALDSQHRLEVLLHALDSSTDRKARRLAARELSEPETRKLGPTRILRGLARAALIDDYRSVRDRSLMSLQAIGDKNTGKALAVGLRHDRPSVRTRAANAISLFPQREVVGDILGTMR